MIFTIVLQGSSTYLYTEVYPLTVLFGMDMQHFKVIIIPKFYIPESNDLDYKCNINLKKKIFVFVFYGEMLIREQKNERQIAEAGRKKERKKKEERRKRKEERGKKKENRV